MIPLAKDFKEAVTVREACGPIQAPLGGEPGGLGTGRGAAPQARRACTVCRCRKEGCLMAGVSKNGEIQGQSLSSLARRPQADPAQADGTPRQFEGLFMS